MSDSTPVANLKNVEDLNPTKMRLTIEVSKEEVRTQEEKAIRSIGKEAKIPGFRPGKVPKEVVQAKFRDKIRNDVLANLLDLGLTSAIQQTKRIPITQPAIKILNDPLQGDAGLEFQAEFEVHPEFEVKNYKGISLKKEKLEATDKEVDEALEVIRDRLSVLEPVPLQQPVKGSFAIVEVGIEWEGVDKKEPAKVITIELGEGKLLPELDAGLMAMKVGDKKRIETRFPDDYYEPKFVGKRATFDCHLMELKKKRLPELNDELAEQIQKGSTLLSLRGEIRNDILKNKMQAQTGTLRNQIIEQLVKTMPFDVPPSMLEQRAEGLRNQIEEDRKKRGAPAVEFKKEDLDAIRERADFQVRASLILSRVAQAESISIDNSRVDERVAQIVQQLQQPPEKTKALLQEKGIMQQLRDEVLTDQVFDFLLSHAHLEEQTKLQKP